MTIKEIQHKFPDLWVLAEVLKQDELGEVTDAKPIVTSKDRDEVYNAIADVPKGTHVTTLYTGEIVGEGQAFSFANW